MSAPEQTLGQATADVAIGAGDEYAALIERMKGELDALARRDGATAAQLTETFRHGARLELGFWEMAYGLEQWTDLETT